MIIKDFRRAIYGLLPVAAFGIFAGYILWYSVFESPQHRYSPDFDGSLWISTGKQTPHGYFVKEIFIPEEVGNAWISAAATDAVDLFVNGKRMASDNFVSLNVSGVHDATGKLQSGKNVIAALVHRSSFPGGPRLLLKGSYTDLSSREHTFFSDNTWMVSSLEEVQGSGSLQWYSPEFDHSGWQKAAIEGNCTDYPVYGTAYPPDLIKKRPSGNWIWHPDPAARSAYFSRDITLRQPAKDAFIGIAATSTYDLAINGVFVARDLAFNKSLDFYNITRMLRPGTNTITIGVVSVDAVPGLLIEGFVGDGGSIADIRSDKTWRTASSVPSGRHPPDAKTASWQTPAVIAGYPSLPWGVLTRDLKDLDIPLSYMMKQDLRFGLFLFAAVIAVACLWLASSFLHARLQGCQLEKSLWLDGIFHFPPLLLLFFVYILKFDVRLDISFPFRYKYILMSVAVLFLLRFLGFAKTAIRQRTAGPGHVQPKRKELFFPLLVAILMVTGLGLRLHDLDYTSLSHDEISLMQYTEGLFQSGVPSKKIGSVVKPLTTYELLPYSISVPLLFFGSSDYAARLHSVFWGTIEILLIYLLGKTLFNRETGILASAIFTFHPWCLNWGQNVFYPQLTQALSTLTILLYYKAIDSSPMSRKYLYLTGISFSLMYLSWEGSGFLLVAMFIAILLHRGSDISWLRNRHLWGGFAILFLTVFTQMARRILYQDSYLIVGAKLSDVGMPTLFFLDPMYDPYYYMDVFLFAENNWMLTILLIAGTIIACRERPLRYLYVLLLGTLFFMTNFLQVVSIRYVYHLAPFLILIASAVIFIFTSRLKGMAGEKDFAARAVIASSAAIMSLIIFASSNSTLLRLYLLSKNPNDPPNLIRRNVYWNDYRSTSKYLQANFKKGDIIFSMTPHTLKYYADYDGDYSLTTLMGKAMIYDVSGRYPGFLDKYMGNPVIVNLHEFKRILSKYNRVWFVSAPNKALNLNVVDDAETIAYIQSNLKVVFESYNAKIYLWER